MSVEEGRSARKVLGAAGSSRAAAKEPAQGAEALPGLEPLRAPPLPQELCPRPPWGWLEGKTTPRIKNHLLQGKKRPSPSVQRTLPGDPRGCMAGPRGVWGHRGAGGPKMSLLGVDPLRPRPFLRLHPGL